MRRPLFLVLFLVALFASACASEGLPNSYTDQDARAERQFIEACEDSLVDTDQANPADYCQCAFYTVASNLTFSEFIDLDNKLKDDPGALTQPQRELLEGVSLPCQFTSADIDLTPVES